MAENMWATKQVPKIKSRSRPPPPCSLVHKFQIWTRTTTDADPLSGKLSKNRTPKSGGKKVKKEEKTSRKKTVATQLVVDSAQLMTGNKVKNVKTTKVSTKESSRITFRKSLLCPLSKDMKKWQFTLIKI
jgi:hypothetical protein